MKIQNIHNTPFTSLLLPLQEGAGIARRGAAGVASGARRLPLLAGQGPAPAQPRQQAHGLPPHGDTEAPLAPLGPGGRVALSIQGMGLRGKFLTSFVIACGF